MNMTVDVPKKDLSFTESLDTVLQHSKQRVEGIFKLSALFSEQIILSDTQFVDNNGIRDLFLKKGFQDFLGEIAIVGMRPRTDISSFRELVEVQIKEQRMRFSSFPFEVQRAVEKGIVKDLDDLNASYPKLRFEEFIDKSDDVYDRTKNKIKVEYQSYPDLVEKSLERKDELQDEGAKDLCKNLMQITKEELKSKNKEEPQRTDFYSAIENSKKYYPYKEYSSYSQYIVKRFFVDYAYNKNFWGTNGFNTLTHPDIGVTKVFKKAYTNIAQEFDSGKYRTSVSTI